jgi:hypothetical protein
MRVIDGHLHIIDDIELFGRDVIFTWNQLNKYMGQVDKVQLMPAMEKHQDSRVINRRFFERLAESPFRERIWGFYWAHAEETRDNGDGPDPSIFEDFKPIISGLKYHPSVSQLEMNRAGSILDMAEDRDLPIIVHCGRNEKSRIEHVIDAYKKRSITVIAAHLGGVSPPLVSRALEMLEQHSSDFDNFYLDTSSIDSTRLLVRAINTVGAKRIIFGTDIPFHDFPVLRYAMQQVWEDDEIEISSSDMRMVFHENVEKIHRDQPPAWGKEY